VGSSGLCQTAGQLGKELLFATLRPVGHVINGEEMSMKPKGLDYDMPAFLKLVTTRLAPEHPAHRDAPDELCVDSALFVAISQCFVVIIVRFEGCALLPLPPGIFQRLS
jgi:hypothetical protein